MTESTPPPFSDPVGQQPPFPNPDMRTGVQGLPGQVRPASEDTRKPDLLKTQKALLGGKQDAAYVTSLVALNGVDALDTIVGTAWNFLNNLTRGMDSIGPSGYAKHPGWMGKWEPHQTAKTLIGDENVKQMERVQTQYEKEHPVAGVIGPALRGVTQTGAFLVGAPGKVMNVGTHAIEYGAKATFEGMAIKFGQETAEFVGDKVLRRAAGALSFGGTMALDPTDMPAAERVSQSLWSTLFGWSLGKWLQLGTRLEMGMGGGIKGKSTAAFMEALGISAEMDAYEQAANALGMSPHDAHATLDFMAALGKYLFTDKGSKADVLREGKRLFVETVSWMGAGGRIIPHGPEFIAPSDALARARALPAEQQKPVTPETLRTEIEMQRQMPPGAEQVPGRDAEFFSKGDVYRVRKGRLEVRKGGKGKWKKTELPEAQENQTDFTQPQKVVAGALMNSPIEPKLREMVFEGLKTLEAVPASTGNVAVLEGRAFLEMAFRLGEPDMQLVGESFVRVMAGRQSAEAAIRDVVRASAPVEPVKPVEPPEVQAIREFGERAFGEAPKDPNARSKWSKFYEAVFNKMEPLEHKLREVEKELPGLEVKPTADPRKVAAALIGSEQGIADVFMRKGAVNQAGEKVGPSWREIIESVPESDLPTVFGYAAARRTVDLAAAGKESGFDVEAAKRAVEAGEKLPKIKETAEAAAKFYDNLLGYLAETGAYSASEIAAMRKTSPFFIPFYRALSEGQAMGAPTKRGRPLKRLKGKSTIPLQDAMKSAQQNVEMMVRAANKQVLLRSLALFHDTVKKENSDIADLFMERIKPPVEPTRVTAEEIARHLDVAKPDLKSAEDMLVFRPQKGEAPDVIQIRVNGERRWYRIDPEVKRLFETPVPPGAGMRFFLGANDFLLRMVRGGAVTVSVPFSVANAFRDAIVSAIQGKSINKIPGVAGAKGGLAEISQIKKFGINALVRKLGIQEKIADYIDIAERYEVGGAAHSSLSEFFAQTSRKAGKEPTFIDQFAHAVGITERAARRDEFVQTWRKAKARGLSDADAMIEATYAAKDLIVNYSRKGVASAAIGRYYLFMTPRLGGQDKLVRTFKDKGVLTTMALGMAYVTLPELLSYLLHGDEEWWLDKSSERQNYILFKIPGMDNLVRLPKAFDWGRLFGTLPMEAWISQTANAPERVKRGMMQQAWDMALSMSPTDSFYPTALRPIAEVQANEQFYSGYPIYPKWMEDELADYRKYNKGTTETAKSIGAMSYELSQRVFKDATADGMSPAIIDHLLNGYSGGIWWRTVSTVEDILGVKVSDQSGAKRVPIVSRFVTEPWTGSRGVSIFYEQLRAHEAMAKALKKDERDIPDQMMDALVELRIYAKEMKMLRDERESGELPKTEANQQIVQKAWEALGRLDELDEASRGK